MKRKDFNKLLHLAKSMGIKIKYKKDDMWAGEWHNENNTIVLFPKSDESWASKILILAHELGHAVDDRIRGVGAEAYEHLPENEDEIGYIPKWARSSIQNREAAADYYKGFILKMLGIKISQRSVDLDTATNLWQYGFILHNNGRHPTRQQIRNFIKSWKEGKGL